MAQFAFDFITEISAQMAGLSNEAYVERQSFYLTKLDEIEEVIKTIKIDSEAEFTRATSIKSLLCSMSCYTFNNKLPENDRVWELESKIGAKMKRWTKKNLAPSDVNRMIRYILWNKYFSYDSAIRAKILDHLLAFGYLAKREGQIVVKGLYCKVGDNVFTGNNRQYVNVCIPQVFELSNRDKEYLQGRDIPELNGEYTLTWMGDGKGRARHPKFNYRDYSKLETMFSEKKSQPALL